MPACGLGQKQATPYSFSLANMIARTLSPMPVSDS